MTRLRRMANVADFCEAWKPSYLAPTALPALADMEESMPARPADGARRHPEPDFVRWRRPPALGRAADPGELLKLATTCVRPPSRGAPAAALTDVAHVGVQSPHSARSSLLIFLVVPTVSFRLVFVLVLPAHDRPRKPRREGEAYFLAGAGAPVGTGGGNPARTAFLMGGIVFRYA